MRIKDIDAIEIVKEFNFDTSVLDGVEKDRAPKIKRTIKKHDKDNKY